jgi:Rrf2 family protein
MFSSKTYLALLIVLELSGKDNTSPLTSKDLAGQYNVSKRYLEVVFNNLAKAGIISSKRGIGGGYFLTSSIDRLSLHDLATAAEGGVRIFSGGDYLAETGDRAGVIKGVNSFWSGLDDTVMDNLRKHKLSDLIKDLNKYKEMYYI